MIGASCSFGRQYGEQSKGIITKVNRKTVKIKLTEARYGNTRTYPVGMVFTVDKSLVYSEDGTMHLFPEYVRQRQRPVVDTSDFHVGQEISCLIKNEWVKATILRVNRKTLSIRVKDTWQEWRISPSLVAKTTDNV